MNHFFFDKDNCLVQISNSILKHFTNESFHSTSKQLDEVFAQKQYDKVCLILLDGYGKSIRELHLNEKDFLRRKTKFSITSVFPPTTVAATTAVISGRYPVETGWLGWRQYFKNHNVVVDMFTNCDSVTFEKIPGPSLANTYCPYTPIWDLIKAKGITASPLYPYPIDQNGPKDINEYFQKANLLMKESGPHFYYMYFSEPDSSMHEFGTKDIRVHRLCKDLNNRIHELAKNNKDNLIIVLSDHSMTDTEYFYLYEHDEFANMVERIYGLDARTCAFYVKPEYLSKFKETFIKYYGDDKFVIKSKEEVIKEKWFGEGTPHPLFESFIGDYLVTSISKYGFTYELDYSLRGNHAGSLEEESIIDVSIINE